MSGGSLRVSIPPGNVSYGNVLDVLPFGNFLVVKKVNASIMTEALNNGLSGWTGDSSGAGRFPQVGGLRYSFNPQLPADSRLVNADLLPSGGGSPVPLASFNGDILLLTADYNANGGDK
jgi:5'-nucleotidase